MMFYSLSALVFFILFFSSWMLWMSSGLLTLDCWASSVVWFCCLCIADDDLFWMVDFVGCFLDDLFLVRLVCERIFSDLLPRLSACASTGVYRLSSTPRWCAFRTLWSRSSVLIESSSVTMWCKALMQAKAPGLDIRIVVSV